MLINVKYLMYLTHVWKLKAEPLKELRHSLHILKSLLKICQVRRL